MRRLLLASTCPWLFFAALSANAQSISNSSGAVVIIGSSAEPNSVLIQSAQAGGTSISLRVSGTLLQELSMPRSEIESVIFQGGSANDEFVNLTNINSTVFGGLGDDSLTGGSGNDALYGQGGDDLLDAGHGDDLLYGGEGRDTLIGGSGSNYYVNFDGDEVIDGGPEPTVTPTPVPTPIPTAIPTPIPTSPPTAIPTPTPDVIVIGLPKPTPTKGPALKSVKLAAKKLAAKRKLHRKRHGH